MCTHRAESAVAPVRGRLLSTPAENFVELGEVIPLVDLVVLGDAMVRRGLVTCADLADAVAVTKRRRGVRLARRAVALVRPRVDSPRETRARLLLVLGGLPEPTPNLLVRDDDGGWLAEVDLGYEEHRVAVEYHGDVHRAMPGRWRSDVSKLELLVSLGWQVVVLTADDMYGRPERVLARVHEALVKAGHPNLPADIDPAWRQHFRPGESARAAS